MTQENKTQEEINQTLLENDYDFDKEIETNIFETENVGDCLIGFYQSTKKEQGKWKSDMIMIKTASGIKGIWANNVLSDKFIGMETGTPIRIEYLGKVEAEKGSYKNYSVKIGKKRSE